MPCFLAKEFMKKRVKVRMKVSYTDRIFNIINFAFMGILGLFLVYPLYYVLIASITEPSIVMSGRLLLWPEEVFVGGYQRIMNHPPIWTGYYNTILYTVTGTAVAIFATIPTAYALSRKDMFGRRVWMFIFTFTMFFQGGLIPLFLILMRLGMLNTIYAIILPTAVSVFNLIVCRTFFEQSIPHELLEAGRIDGCNDFGFFFRIVMPISSTIVAVMILFYSTALWNMFMPPLMFLSDMGRMPLQVILRNLIIANQVQGMVADATEIVDRIRIAQQIQYGVIVVSALPLLIVYPFLQKYFAKGVMIGSVKG